MTEPIRGITPINDPHYRYQMKKMIVKKERTKVTITNIEQVSKDLKIPSSDILVTYIGKKMSAKPKVEKVGDRCDRVSFACNTDPSIVEQTIYNFIETFVLCPTCKLPELAYDLDKTQTKLFITCNACGHRGLLETDKISDSTSKKIIQVLKDDLDEEDNHNTDDNNNTNDNRTDNNNKNKNKQKKKRGLVNPLDMLLEQEEQDKNRMSNFS